MNLVVRPLMEGELDEADRIMRLAFGTFIGLKDPMAIWGDAGYAHSRWRSDPDAALAAEMDGRLVGSNFAVKWGSLGYFGPLSVLPQFWNKKVGQVLLDATMDLFADWGVRHRGLYTFSNSPKHIALYQRYGFWPRFLTAVLSKQIEPRGHQVRYEKLSELSERAKPEAIAQCRELTDSIYGGLDVSHDIEAIDRLRIGETVLLRNGSVLDAFAASHIGPGTEAGSGVCFVKFAAVRPGRRASGNFDSLIEACQAMAVQRGATRLRASVNLARERAYQGLARHRFRSDQIGVAMQSPNEPAYNRPSLYVLDDWR